MALTLYHGLWKICKILQSDLQIIRFNPQIYHCYPCYSSSRLLKNSIKLSNFNGLNNGIDKANNQILSSQKSNLKNSNEENYAPLTITMQAYGLQLEQVNRDRF